MQKAYATASCFRTKQDDAARTPRLIRVVFTQAGLVADIATMCELLRMAEAKLLSEPTNFAIVHLPGRAFPGVVFQGDSLHILICDIRAAVSEADQDDRALISGDVLEWLLEVQRAYEHVLDREGIRTPYTRYQSS